jgi:hypothetical protein
MTTTFLLSLLLVTGTAFAQTDVLTIDGTKVGTTSPTNTVRSPTRAEEKKESGEKGGTEDINIGVGELQETPSIEPDEIDAKATDDDGQEGGNVEFEWKVEEGESTPEEGIDDVKSNEDPQEGSTDYLLKLGGVEGESTKGGVPGVEPDEIDAKMTDDSQRGGTEDINIGVGELQETPGVEPDEIDVMEDSEPVMPDFSILLGGGDGGAKPSDENLQKTADILLEGMNEEGAPVETLSLNFEKIKTTSKQKVKFLGFIPMDITATVEIDAEQEVKVIFPWWSFLVAGKDETIGEQIFNSISNVLKTKHDTVKNSIGNIR